MTPYKQYGDILHISSVYCKFYTTVGFCCTDTMWKNRCESSQGLYELEYSQTLHQNTYNWIGQSSLTTYLALSGHCVLYCGKPLFPPQPASSVPQLAERMPAWLSAPEREPLLSPQEGGKPRLFEKAKSDNSKAWCLSVI